MQAIGILGGVFDPPHWGHLWLARRLGREVGLAEVRLMPSARPPHKPPPVAPARHRIAALCLAAHGDPLLRVDGRELQQPGPSYTVDSVRTLRKELKPGRPLCLLLGMDAFLDFSGWREWRAILECAHLVVAGRSGVLASPACRELAARVVRDRARLRATAGGAIYMACYTGPAVSSVLVRTQIAGGGSPVALVPTPVLSYIQKHSLYRTTHGI